MAVRLRRVVDQSPTEHNLLAVRSPNMSSATLGIYTSLACVVALTVVTFFATKN